MFERRQDADGVQIIVVANVGDAEKFALHLTLAGGDDRIEGLAELFYNLAGIDAVGRRDRSKRRRRGRGVELEAEGHCARARHFSAKLSIVYEFFPTLG